MLKHQIFGAASWPHLPKGCAAWQYSAITSSAQCLAAKACNSREKWRVENVQEQHFLHAATHPDYNPRYARELQYSSLCWLLFVCLLLFLRLLAVVPSFACCCSFVCLLLFLRSLAVVHSFACCCSFVCLLAVIFCLLLFILCRMYIHSLLAVSYVQIHTHSVQSVIIAS